MFPVQDLRKGLFTSVSIASSVPTSSMIVGILLELLFILLELLFTSCSFSLELLALPLLGVPALLHKVFFFFFRATFSLLFVAGPSSSSLSILTFLIRALFLLTS